MEITRELLLKYHLKTCTPEQKAAVEVWLKGQELDMDFPAGMGDGKDVEKVIWESLTKRLDFTENNQTSSPREFLEKPSWRILTPYYFIGAAASVLFVLTFTFWLLNKREKVKEVAVKPQIQTIAFVTIKTKSSQKRNVTLPDGSQVTLNSRSEIRFPTLFLVTDSVRSVYLKGEAFFNVAKNPEKPFIVHTEKSLTRVLGTRFNINAYEKNGSVMLVVQEGKVKFSDTNGKRHWILTANQRGILNHSGSLVKDNVYVNRYFAWKENKLLFDNQSLIEIADELERWYGVQVEIMNPKLKQTRYTGSFVSKPIGEVLETISYATGFKYRVEKNKVVIY